MNDQQEALERDIEGMTERHALLRTEIVTRGGAVPPQLQDQLRSCGDELALRRALLAAVGQGHPSKMPSVGAKYLVSTSGRDLKQRGRSGLRFEHRARREVEVVSGSEKEIERRVRSGASVVSPAGMIAILADDGLVATLSTGAPDDRDAELAAVYARAEAAEREAADLRAQVAAARRGAPESNDGSPARLKASAAARAKAEAEAGDTKLDDKK